MSKSTRWIVTSLALAGSALQAQNITGTWQGTLKAGPQELRTVFKIALEDDKYKGTLYSIDQNPTPIQTSSFTKDGTVIKYAISAINGSYEGRLSADGNTITGTWTQFGNPSPLNLVRATPETAWTIPEPLPPPKTMAADAKPEFEVSTIKPSKPDARFSLLVNRSGMMNTTNTSLADLIKFAYDLHEKQIVGGAPWMETEKFDVTGKPDTEGLPNPTQLKMMVQKMLADRFQLSFHREKRELPVYAITIVKGGHKLKASESTSNLPGYGRNPRGMMVMNSTITQWAAILGANTLATLDKPVVDQTGLGDKRWDFTLNYTPDAALAAQAAGGAGTTGQPAAPGDPDAPPDLFTAFQQQLGLKLESTKAPVDVIVVDRVEKPSEN
jgi:uncharacterized protein (TIGR03435 family)